MASSRSVYGGVVRILSRVRVGGLITDVGVIIMVTYLFVALWVKEAQNKAFLR